MATSGIINGTVSQNPTRYFPKLFWQDISPSQDWRIANNASVIRIYSLVENDGSTYDWNGTCSGWALTVTGHAPVTLASFNSNSDSGWTYPSGWAGVTSKKTELIPESGSIYHDFTVYHNPDGQLSVSVSHSYALPAGGWGTGNVSISGIIYLDQIPRATVMTGFNSFTMNGSDIVITAYATSYYAGFTLDFALKLGTTVIAQWQGQAPIVGSNQAYSFSLPVASQNAILALMPNDTQKIVSMTVITKQGGVQVGNTDGWTATCYVGSAIIPSLNNFSHAEATTSPNIATIVGKYVKGLSTLTLTCVGASVYPNSGATITGYKLVYLGVTYEQVGYTFTTAPIPWTASGTIYAYTKDSRGRWSEAKTLSLTALDYSLPNISVGDADRYLNASGTLNDEGTYLGVKVSSTVKSLVNGTEKNKAYLQIRIRQIAPTVGSWVVVRAKALVANTLTNQMYGYWGTYSITSSFEVECTLYDELTKTHVFVDQVSTTKVIMDWDDVGVGIGKTRTNGVLDIAGQTTIHSGGLGVNKVRTQGALDVEGDAFISDRMTVGDGVQFVDHLDMGQYKKQKVYSPQNQTELNAIINSHSAFPDSSSYEYLIQLQVALSVPFTGGEILVKGHRSNSLYGFQQTFQYGGFGVVTWMRSMYNGTWTDWIESTNCKKGTNSNGTYLKFRDGTLIMYGTITGVYISTGVIGISVPFPYTMASGDGVFIGSALPSSSWNYSGYSGFVIVANAIQATTSGVMMISSNYAQYFGGGRWFAVGRWY